MVSNTVDRRGRKASCAKCICETPIPDNRSFKMISMVQYWPKTKDGTRRIDIPDELELCMEHWKELDVFLGKWIDPDVFDPERIAMTREERKRDDEKKSQTTLSDLFDSFGGAPGAECAQARDTGPARAAEGPHPAAGTTTKRKKRASKPKPR